MPSVEVTVRDEREIKCPVPATANDTEALGDFIKFGAQDGYALTEVTALMSGDQRDPLRGRRQGQAVKGRRMRVEAEIKVPGTILMLADDTVVPDDRVCTRAGRLYIEGREVGDFVAVTNMDYDHVVFEGAPITRRETIYHSTTIGCVLDL